MNDQEKLISLAAKFHGIDVPVQAIRKDGEHVVIVIQGGKELRCKFHDLIDGETKATPASKPAQPAKRKTSKKGA